ncbi:hypothetical protein GCM10009775_03140 [Microbacterium aoyamense]|uniref:Uncharacterized protein n=1 Tax=Microbacterium aoyamense TaxID=344166 RepID=A0ABN2P9D3_9MICO
MHAIASGLDISSKLADERKDAAAAGRHGTTSPATRPGYLTTWENSANVTSRVRSRKEVAMKMHMFTTAAPAIRGGVARALAAGSFCAFAPTAG